MVYRISRAFSKIFGKYYKIMKSRKWKKILYEDQDVPDNYVDETFLDDMKKNLNTRTYDFWTVVYGSGIVTQQISSVCIYVVVFIYMDSFGLSPQYVFVTTSAMALLAYILNDFLDSGETRKVTQRTRWDDMKTLLIFMAFSYGLSPVLMTLTETISTDTIYAMTFFMLLANLLFHDYGADAAMVSQSLSLNAAFFASVCLASRLPTTWHAFTTVTFAVEMFALWPVFRKRLKTHFPWTHPWLTVTLGVSALCVVFSVSTVAAVLFGLLHLFINFVCPAWLIKLQPFKNNIHGPWDEAEIKD